MSDQPQGAAGATLSLRIRRKVRTEWEQVFIIVKDTFTHLLTREGIMLMTVLVGVVLWGPKGVPIFRSLLCDWITAVDGDERWRLQLLSFATGTLLLVVVPLLIIRFRFHEPFTRYGLGLGNVKLGAALAMVLLAISVPLFYFGTFDASMRWEYPMLYRGMSAAERIAAFHWDRFILYEAAYISFFFVIEFVFRGFLLFGMQERFGRYAVLFQMLSYTAWHLVKPIPELTGTLFWGFATAAVTLRARSMWYVFIAHWLLNIFMDVMILHQQGVF
jgi:hypothetical protein